MKPEKGKKYLEVLQ